MIIVSSEPFVEPHRAESDARKAWMILSTAAAASYTKRSPQPITTIYFADIATLKNREYYTLDMSVARDLQQKMKSDAIDENEAYARIKAALTKISLSE